MCRASVGLCAGAAHAHKTPRSSTASSAPVATFVHDAPDATAATLSGARRAGRLRSHGRRGRLRPPEGTISGPRSLLRQSRQTVSVVQSRAAVVRLLLARRQGRSRKLNSLRRSQVCGFKFASSMPATPACTGALSSASSARPWPLRCCRSTSASAARHARSASPNGRRSRESRRLQAGTSSTRTSSCWSATTF